MKSYFENKKKEISIYLKQDFKSILYDLNYLNKDLIDNLISYSLRGKMARGAMVCLAFDSFLKDKTEKYEYKDIIKLASIIELIESSLLIHDDIMDKDLIRRDHDSIHYHYSKFDIFNNKINNLDYGNNIGLCIGNIFMLSAFYVLSNTNLNVNFLFNYINKVLLHTNMAQIKDVHNSTFDIEIEKDDIIDLYINKTAKYTFELPLIMGAFCFNNNSELIKHIKNFAKNLGIIFQIKDDLLDFSANSGKDRYSDVKENKKTLLRYYFLNYLDYDKTKNIFKRNTLLSKEDINFLEENFFKVEAFLEEDIKYYYNKCLKEIQNFSTLFNMKEDNLSYFKNLLDYCYKREK